MGEIRILTALFFCNNLNDLITFGEQENVWMAYLRWHFQGHGSDGGCCYSERAKQIHIIIIVMIAATVHTML